MDRTQISFLVESLSRDPREVAAKYADRTIGEIAKTETNIAILVNHGFAMDKLLWLPESDEVWFKHKETLGSLAEGLLGHVHDVPVYSDWYYRIPTGRADDAEPRVGILDLSTNEIFLIDPEKFRA